MLQGKKGFHAAASAALLALAFAGGNAIAAPSQSFTADLNTMEFLVPSPLCGSQQGGVGAGTGSSNVFAKTSGGSAVPVGMTSTDCVDSSGAQLSFYNGHFILTGPGGDSITATYSGNLIPTAQTTSNGQLLVTYTFYPDATFTITGGTGRYVNASGNGTISGSEIVNTSNGTSQGKLKAVGNLMH
jgi:hypothetical protein